MATLLNFIYRFINNAFLRFGFEIEIRRKRKLEVHSLAASDGSHMEPYIRLLEQFSSIDVQNIFEVGAQFGQDAEYLRMAFGVGRSDTYIFEPHPEIANEAALLYRHNVQPIAVSDFDGTTTLEAVDLDNLNDKNAGISSLRTRAKPLSETFQKIEVPVVRMDSFIEKVGVSSIDFLKIDVEGETIQVLRGFGKKLGIVRSLQLEAEHEVIWRGKACGQRFTTSSLPKTSFSYTSLCCMAVFSQILFG